MNRQFAKAASFGMPGGLAPQIIMKYNRKWADQRNAVGFVAACARLALSFYSGPRRETLEVAVKCVERYVDGKGCDSDAFADSAMWLSKSMRKGSSGRADRYASRAVAAAARYVGHPQRSHVMNTLIKFALEAGVDDYDIDVAYARWIVRDLSPRWPIDEQIRLAAGAAIVAGSEALAKEILA